MTDHELLSHFQRQPNGMWACIKPFQLSGPNGSVSLGPGASFNKGVQFMGVDLASELDAAAARLGR
jgi:hypothetical protein